VLAAQRRRGIDVGLARFAGKSVMAHCREARRGEKLLRPRRDARRPQCGIGDEQHRTTWPGALRHHGCDVGQPPGAEADFGNGAEDEGTHALHSGKIR